MCACPCPSSTAATPRIPAKPLTRARTAFENRRPFFQDPTPSPFLMRIAVVGSGYVGLVVGTCFADSGNDVICVDVDAAKIEKLAKGVSPIYEPGLEERLNRNIEEGRLRFTTKLDEAVRHALIVFIAVGTPPGEDGSADLKYVLAAARGIGKAMDGFKVIVDKSTVPVGTSRKVA